MDAAALPRGGSESVDPSFPAIISKTSRSFLSGSPRGRLESVPARWPQKHSSSREVSAFYLKSSCCVCVFVCI